MLLFFDEFKPATSNHETINEQESHVRKLLFKSLLNSTSLEIQCNSLGKKNRKFYLTNFSLPKTKE